MGEQWVKTARSGQLSGRKSKDTQPEILCAQPCTAPGRGSVSTVDLPSGAVQISFCPSVE